MHEKDTNYYKVYSLWIETEKILKLNNTIDLKNQRITSINMETGYWEKVLYRLLSIFLFLSKKNLAFRGCNDKFYTYKIISHRYNNRNCLTIG